MLGADTRKQRLVACQCLLYADRLPGQRPSIHCSAGLFTALGALQNAAHPPMMNLRDVNPYVASALADWSKGAPIPSAPRQLGPMPDCSPARAAGTSSFGMSGTNAYAVGALAADAGVTAPPSDAIWHRTRYFIRQPVPR